MKPKRGKKKRSRVRAGVAKTGASRTKRATVETTDAEPEQGELDASPGDDADADADGESEDSASANAPDVPDVAAGPDGPEPDAEDAAAEARDVEDVEHVEHDDESGDAAELADDARDADDAGVAVPVHDRGAPDDHAAFDQDGEDLADGAGEDAGDVEPGDADHADPADLAAALQDVEHGDRRDAGDIEDDGAGEGEAESGGTEAESESPEAQSEADADADADTPEARQARRKSILESLLFASDKPLSLKRMSELMHERQLVLVREALDALLLDYQDRGIELCEVAGGWQFRTAAVNSQWVQQLVGGKPVRLSRAQLETLAIVAYRQPITRPEIDEIRGVDSGGTLKVLLDRNLIRVLGKKEEPGRPLLYGTSKEFLTFFNLNDLRELPTLREYHELTEDSRRVVEARLGMDLDDLPGKGTIAIEADGETLAADVAADLGLGTARAGQASEEQDVDADGSDEWASQPGASEEWAPEAGDAVGSEASEEWAPEAGDAVGSEESEEWAPEASDTAGSEEGEEWAPEAGDAVGSEESEEWAPEAGDAVGSEESEEWAPEASDMTVPDMDESLAAGGGEVWVEETEASTDAEPEASADADLEASPEAMFEAMSDATPDESGEASGHASGEASGEASEEHPQRATPEAGSTEEGLPEPGAATREEG